MSPLKRIGWFLLVGLLPSLVALYVMSTGADGAWNPTTVDLWVYFRAAQELAGGRDLYHLTDAYPFIYPPFAGVLGLPMLLVGWRAVQVLWTIVSALLVVVLLRHLGVRKAWQLTLAAAAAFAVLAPLVVAGRLGQLGTLLMVMVVVDLVDGPPLIRGRGGERLLPVGILTGLAAGLKLTPAIFIVYLFLVGRRKAGITATITFLATVVIGLIASPRYAPGYWLRLAGGDSGANPDAFGWIHNISVQSSIQRFGGVGGTSSMIGLLLGGVVALIALIAAWRCTRGGQPLFAVAMLGLVSSFANPITWSHHLTWVLPLIVAIVREPLALAPRLTAGIAVLWYQLQPQTMLGGAPWAHREIYEYQVWEKVFAAGPAIVALILALTALFGAVPRNRVEQPDRLEPPGPEPAHPAAEAPRRSRTGETAA